MFGLDGNQTARLVYLTVLLVILLGSVGFGRGRRPGRFRFLGIWILIGGALVMLYAYREPVMRFADPVMREVAPGRISEVTTPSGAKELVVARADDGHFYIDAKANGASVRFLVDTGATGTVLTLGDARRAGIDVDRLAFNRPVETANGTAFYAGAMLDSLTIGPRTFNAVPVGIMPDQAASTSLLGMSSIDRFSSWRIEGDRMALAP